MSFFGKLRGSKPSPTLNDSADSLNQRDNELYKKVKRIEDEIQRYKTQMNNTKTESGRRAIKTRVVKLMRQREVYRRQRDVLQGQVINIDSVKFANDSMKDNIEMVSAMKSANKAMAKNKKKLDIDKVTEVFEDMQDILEDNDEIQNIMSQDFTSMEQVDDDELLAEFENFENEEVFVDEPESFMTEKTPENDSTTAGTVDELEEDKLKTEMGL